MSRGFGRVQRAILGYMVADRRHPWSAHELAERILGSASTSAQFSIRRALANLGAAGTIAEVPNNTGFWRMAANKRHRQPRENRKRKEEECCREKDLRQSRLVNSAKMLSILGSDHEGDAVGSGTS